MLLNVPTRMDQFRQMDDEAKWHEGSIDFSHRNFYFTAPLCRGPYRVTSSFHLVVGQPNRRFCGRRCEARRTCASPGYQWSFTGAVYGCGRPGEFPVTIRRRRERGRRIRCHAPSAAAHGENSSVGYNEPLFDKPAVLYFVGSRVNNVADRVLCNRGYIGPVFDLARTPACIREGRGWPRSKQERWRRLG
jgi:hypothetical protein